jgi:hypothetical protein
MISIRVSLSIQTKGTRGQRCDINGELFHPSRTLPMSVFLISPRGSFQTLSSQSRGNSFYEKAFFGKAIN